MILRVIAVVTMLLALALAPLPASHAQAPYYAGKTIELLVGFPPGGLTDLQGRIMAPFFEKHILGNPRVVIRNMPGGGAILAANWFQANAKPDGLTLFVSGGGPLIADVLKQKEAKISVLGWKPIAMTGGGGVMVFSPRAGVRAAADLHRATGPIIFGGISATGTDLAVLLAFELLSPPNWRAVMGFEGKGPSLQALLRGEITVDQQTTAAAYLSNVLPFVKEGKLVPVFSLGLLTEKGLERDPAVPDIPTVYEAYQILFNRKPDFLIPWKAYQAILAAAFSYRGGIFAPGNIRPEALQALLSSVDLMKADPEFKEKGKVMFEYFPLLRGDTAEPALRKALTLTPAVREYILDLLRKKYKVDI